MMKASRALATILSVLVLSCWAGAQLPYGDPGRADVVAQHEGFTVGYCKGHRQAAWVAYELTREKVKTNIAKRGSGNYFQDRDCCPGMVASPDFSRLDCDHGHLAPAADMHWSEKAMRESFMFSNMSPQKHGFNFKVWLTLERYVRGFAVTEERIYVITGPVLPMMPNYSTMIGSRLTIPEAFYKVIYAVNARKMIGFVVPHKEDLVNPKPFACSVDEVEKRTGLDFFSTLPQDLQKELESTFDMASWVWMQCDE